jgi:hypothetical protein
MSIGLPITVLLIGLTGYMVAGRALRPVDLMARHAAKISAERLDDRLAISNPDDESAMVALLRNKMRASLPSLGSPSE